MKLKYFVAALAVGAASGAYASSTEEERFQALTEDGDSLKMLELGEAVVKAVKAPDNAPFAVTKISQKTLSEFAKSGRELPFLFARTPGIMAWSENGLGTGTTYMRLRGAGGSRINVTLDGISLNSPEDQCVFWANMNSYAALLGNVEIQRGVGTSTNGDGAFGGTIALTTALPKQQPSVEVSFSGGSYNTFVYGGKASTGLLANHIVIDAAYHETQTDGYIHGTDGRSGSYYGGLTFYNTDRNFKLSYKNIGNFEKTGQAWNGVDTGELLDWNYGGMGTGIHNYKDLCDAGLGRYNSLYEYLNDGSDPAAGTSRYQMADGTFWPRTTDNFWQNHNLLNATWKVDEHWTVSGTLHYTHGHGYYDEFRPDNKLSKFGLTPFILANGETLKKTDFVRQKGLTQDVYGLSWNVNYTGRRLDLICGTSLQNFKGNHWGYLTYAANAELSAVLFKDGDYQYYDSDATKGDDQVFAKATVHLTPALDVYGDVQYRHVSYFTNGINDRFLENADGSYSNQRLKIKEQYHFVNPKAGISFHRGGHKAYLSYALSHREPERNNFTDNGSYPAPKAESVHDVELGYGFANARWHASLGGYAMIYHNQFVQTGQVSDIGEALTTNIKRSYRMGVEVSAGVDVTSWLTLEANASLSQNRIKDFDEYVEDWDNGGKVIHYKVIHYDNSTLAFSPSALVNGFIDFHYAGFAATWHTGFVSKMYLDNTECDQRSLPKYTRTDIALSYDWKLRQKHHLIFGVQLDNIFNAHYAAGGWVYSAIYESGGNPNSNRYTQIGYIPMAGFNAMGSITYRF